MEDVLTELKKVRDAARAISTLDDAKRQDVLLALASNLRDARTEILAANAMDCAEADKSSPWYDRLMLDEKRLLAIAADVENVAHLPSPLGSTLGEKTLPNGLIVRRVSVPIGTIGVIYEARPNVTVDVFALCFKSGNAVALKGGKEAHNTNAAFAKMIRQTLSDHGVTPDAAYLLPPDRAATAVMLNAVGLIDVCIPRGSQGLIDFVRSNARVPVIETGAGIVHVYFDAAGDLDKGRDIINNSKTRRVSVCNALDTLVIHQSRLSDLPALMAPLGKNNVEIFADAPALDRLKTSYPEKLLNPATDEDFGREFLSYKMSVKTVANLAEALDHIARYSSSHSEAIVTEDAQTAKQFMDNVDAAAVYHNASTAFTDGGQFGLGAEIGISTQKLHARGPMALEALTSYKWLVFGNGQTRQ